MRLLLVFSLFLFSCQSYKALHRDAIVVDTHNDVLSSATMKGLNIENDLTGKTHSDIARFKKGGVDVQVFSIFCDERFGKDTAFKFANIEIDSLYAIVGRNGDKLMMVATPAQLQEAVAQKKLACMMGVEGGHMMEDRLSNLDSFYKRGVCYMTLTWNNSTAWATSALDETRKKDSLPHKGLTDFGKQVVRRMNELGMMVDLSHVGEQTFWDAINTTSKPVIVSHSCAYALNPVFRNLKDEQIKAVGKNGGVIHLNFYSGFVDSNYNKNKAAFLARHRSEVDSLRKQKWAGYEIEEGMAKKYPQEVDAYRPSLSQLLDHLDYIVKLAGVDHVGLGSDFDGIESAPKPLDDVTAYPLITKALLKRGYSKADVKKILGENFIRVFKANMMTGNR
ncbi:dipeptidase [Flavisolibacter ginsenosidimutans]|uniref:Membrane dipeptidase n=1 Tax=Flavisolibacter ginsenosidimutans TaxID=661481 RepID=A0A5B8UN92_9BACT|nr:dipeptidase [Flavisolibacter ginsenosidimutans]QEC57445.1 membrane dipeptidase [Flavisolibacter ginsenosidimutans]